MKLLESLALIQRIDHLIQLKATGSPNCLANRLSVSESSVHRLLRMMKEMGAPICYSSVRQSYFYEKEVKFRFGFYDKEIKMEQL